MELAPTLGSWSMCLHAFNADWDKAVFRNLDWLLHKYALLDNSVDGLEATGDLS